MPRAYSIYDVFTDRVLAGNPLAVVHDGTGLGDSEMQAIAREFNLSETVFVLPAENPAHSARIRIFTTGRELPFAGHPTVGTAIALAERQHGSDSDLSLVSVLEENVGPVRCAVSLHQGKPSFAEFNLPRRSQGHPHGIARDQIADALGIAPSQIGFENHTVTLWSAGVPFLMVPVHDLSVAKAVDFSPQAWEALAPMADGQLAWAYVYCRGGVHHEAKIHARMFCTDPGMIEDPATGSAVAALSGALHHFDQYPEGHHAILIEQGVEMGRPSLIHLHLDIQEGAIQVARIGGQAVKLAEGALNL